MTLETGIRLERLRRRLAETGLDGILISQPENRYYLSGFDGSAGFLLITVKHTILATDFRYLEQAGRQAAGYEIFKTVGEAGDWFPGLAADLDIGKLGFEAEDITFASYRQLTDALKPAKLRLEATTGLVASLRAVKEPAEIELITRAVEIADRAFGHARNTIRTGITESELAWEIEKFLREQGSQTVPFELIVASGPNAALPHARPSQRAIGPGEPVVIDIGARFHSYTSDLSRTIWLGAADDRLTRVYDTVLGAQLTALAIIKKDMTGEAADGLARTVIDHAGYAGAFGHGLGHGIGLATHELPRLGPKSGDILADGMVFTVEPGIYLAGWGGVRIEDVVVMESGKPKVLSQARKVFT